MGPGGKVNKEAKGFKGNELLLLLADTSLASLRLCRYRTRRSCPQSEEGIKATRQKGIEKILYAFCLYALCLFSFVFFLFHIPVPYVFFP
jgi:hypothetical protein